MRQSAIRTKTSPFIILLCTLLIACQPTQDPPTPPPSPTTVLQNTPSPLPSATATLRPSATVIQAAASLPHAAPLKGGRALLGLVGTPQTLNPIFEPNTALRTLTPFLFMTLLQVDPMSAELRPALAQDWNYSPDGQHVTFHLPPDLTWSDGSPLTAADIVDSLQATHHPALRSFSTIEALDKKTLRLSFININCADVTHLALLPLLPASQILEPTPIGSGPFMVTDWSENRRTLTLTQNPHYHNPTPFLDGVTIRFIDQDSLTIALSEGQFDAVGPLPAGITLPNLEGFKQLTYAAPEFIYIAINFDPRNEPPLPTSIRQVLPLALDRQAILDETLAGEGQILATSLLSTHWAANQSLTPPPYAPNKAAERLIQAGLGDSDGDGWLDRAGERVTVSIRLNGKNKLHQRLGWLVSSYYRDLGLFARAQSLPPDSLIDELFTHDFSLAIFSWPMLPDPDQRHFWHSTENQEALGLNFGSYNNPQLDNLLLEGVAVPGCSSQARADIYAQLQDTLAQKRPADFLLTPNQHILLSSHLQGLSPGPFVPFTWNVESWHLQ